VKRADGRDSGDKIRRPGGAFGRGKKGEEERRLRPSYRRGWGRNGQVLKGIKGGEEFSPAGLTRGRNGWRRKTLMWPDEWGPHVSGIREKIRDTGSVSFLGCGLLLLTGPNRSLRPFSIFHFFSSFLFLFSYFLSRICILNPNQAKPIS
jgi:hypothetical protein